MSVMEQIRADILKALPDAKVDVSGGGGHFTIRVVSEAFRGQGMLAQQRLVYAAITPLMKGDNAPVHAVDSLICLVP